MSAQKTPTEKRPLTIAGILASALDMEDQISHSVYHDYLDRARWPGRMNEEVFQNIRSILMTLLKDTQRHKNILVGLQRRYDADVR